MVRPGPPEGLVRSIVDGPGPVRDLEWHTEIPSTNARALELGERGAPEIHAVLADRQTAGRGRRGRQWQAPSGTSLLLSLLLRPEVEPEQLPLLPLLAGLAVAEVVDAHVSVLAHPPDVGVKWPNDVLVEGHKVAGILVEAGSGGAVAVGIGCNVDWRGVERPPELAMATSIAERCGAHVDRWRVLAGLIGVFSRRYGAWREEPSGFLQEYRQRCATVGQRVRVTQEHAATLEGLAVGVASDGVLKVLCPDGLVRLSAGQVEHVRTV